MDTNSNQETGQPGSEISVKSTQAFGINKPLSRVNESHAGVSVAVRPILSKLSSQLEGEAVLRAETRDLLGWLARKEINTLTTIPPLASQCCHHIFLLEDEFQVSEHLNQKLDGNDAFNIVSKSRKYAYLALTGCEKIQFVLRNIEELLEKREFSVPEVADHLVLAPQKPTQLRFSAERISRARQHLVSGEMNEALVCLDDAMEECRSALLLLRERSQKTVQLSDPEKKWIDNKSIRIENTYYLSRLASFLRENGVGEKVLENLSSALFERVEAGPVRVSELFDEEIQLEATSIPLEVIRKVRLEIRHNDLEYPLSVAHKGWIDSVSSSSPNSVALSSKFSPRVT